MHTQDCWDLEVGQVIYSRETGDERDFRGFYEEYHRTMYLVGVPGDPETLRFLLNRLKNTYTTQKPQGDKKTVYINRWVERTEPFDKTFSTLSEAEDDILLHGKTHRLIGSYEI